MTDIAVGSPDWWLARLMRRLGDRQPDFDKLEDYAKGDHPLPNGDTRYVQALRDLQRKAQTNYISLVLKGVTQRMQVKDFKFAGEVDDEATRFWKANNMELQSSIAIYDAAKLREAYALVSPPDEGDETPVITVENPRNCIVETDPIRPTRTRAGLKIYDDDLIEKKVAILYLPGEIYVYHGPKPTEKFEFEAFSRRIASDGASAGGFVLDRVLDNPLGDIVPLVRGMWQPETGLAECEDGAFQIQDRINHTMLDRLIITKSQAYRQRMLTGVRPSQKGNKLTPPFDPGADAIWITDEVGAKVWDLDQAEIGQLLEAIRDDIGDLAALTQTPVTYLTNRMVNVSGDTLQMAMQAHAAKVRRRMAAMGTFFEQIIKLCFRYTGSPKADEIDAEVHWADPEVRTLAEMADMVTKFADVIPLELIMERVGFSSDEIERAITQMKIEKEEQQMRDLELAEKQAAIRAAGSRLSRPSGGGSSGSSGSSSQSK